MLIIAKPLVYGLCFILKEMVAALEIASAPLEERYVWLLWSLKERGIKNPILDDKIYFFLSKG